jgi:hypothetical protein
MVELRGDGLVFTFPEVHPAAACDVTFMRTLRIPDDDRTYALPPGLGSFPLRHVDDFARRVPARWLDYGGVMLPMYQAEAMWLAFSSRFDRERLTFYPFALKIATGKVDALTGGPWSPDLRRRAQNYLVVPKQPWLDGYCVQKGVIRQFVAMPLGQGYTAEEQITGAAEYGGLQIMAVPMKRSVYEERFPVEPEPRGVMRELDSTSAFLAVTSTASGLAPGGKMRQEIYEDPYRLADWDTEHTSRCFVHIANSMNWQQITGEQPPTTPPSAKQYTKAGLPWFDFYDESLSAVSGSQALAGMSSVADLSNAKREPLADNEPVTPERVVVLRRGMGKHQVREFSE